MKFLQLCATGCLLTGAASLARAQSALLADVGPSSVTQPGAHYGQALALSGDRLVVGAPRFLVAGEFAGAVQVFERAPSGAWNATATLLAPTPQDDDDYGYAVAALGNRLMIGAPVDELVGGTESCGVVHAFERQADASWQLQAQLTLAGAKAFDHFGVSVALRPGRALVGAPRRDFAGVNEGAAYVFEPGAGGQWVQKAELRAANPQAYELAGSAVALNGERALLGSPFLAAGRVHVFERSPSGAWNEVATLVAHDGAVGDQFGYAVALDGNRAAIGAYKHSHQGVKRGAVYVFERDPAGTWAYAAEFRSVDGGPGEQFGWSVALEGDQIVAGAPGNNGDVYLSGRAYRFLRDPAGTWQQVGVFAKSPLQKVAGYGFAVASSGGRCAVGAPYVHTAGTVTGRAYLYDAEALDVDAKSLSLSSGGTANLALEAGFAHAGELALVLGSVSGTAPGQPIAPGLSLPLNPDAYFAYTLAQPNHAPLSGSLQVLGAGGAASASFTLPAASSASLVGTLVQHAFVTIDVAAGAITFASNARAVELLP